MTQGTERNSPRQNDKTNELRERVNELRAWARSRIEHCRREEHRLGVERRALDAMRRIEAATERRALEAAMRILSGEES